MVEERERTGVKGMDTGVLLKAGRNDIAGNSSTTAVLPISANVTQGRFETPNDSDWYRVTLQKGVDYTVSGSSNRPDAVGEAPFTI